MPDNAFDFIDPEQITELLALERQIQQQQISPYPDLVCPDYRTGRYGQWNLDRYDVPFLRGYFTCYQAASPNYRLFRGHTIWMSCTPMERESLAPHAACAYGNVVIMGLGMGLLLYNILQREEVERVTIIECDREIVELFHHIATPEAWDNWHKAEIVIADALHWQPSEPVDFLSVDIWPKLWDNRLLEDSRKIQRNVNAKQVALWGQELDFMGYVAERGYDAPPTLEQYCEYVQFLGLPLIELDNPDYPEYCYRAALNSFGFGGGRE